MSERSEFGRRAASGEARRAPPRLCAADRVRRRDLLVSFGSRRKKLARAAGESPALALALAFAPTRKKAGSRSSPRLPRAPRAASFCLVKRKHDSANALSNGEAGPEGERQRRESNRHRRTRSDAMKPHRSPVLLGRRGTLGPSRFRSPHSLRSDMGCSSTPSSCDARLALRLERSRSRARSRSTARSQARATATATAMAEAKAGARATTATAAQCAKRKRPRSGAVSTTPARCRPIRPAAPPATTTTGPGTARRSAARTGRPARTARACACFGRR